MPVEVVEVVVHGEREQRTTEGGAPAAPPAPRGAPRDTAAEVLATLRAGGPVSAARLARAMGLHLTTVLYHLRRLKKAGSVVQRCGLWGVAGGASSGGAQANLGPSMSRVLTLLQASGSLDHRSIAEVLGVSRPAVTAIVSRLRDRGYVHVQADGRRKLVSLPTPGFGAR